jgi:hypothetical protein
VKSKWEVTRDPKSDFANSLVYLVRRPWQQGYEAIAVWWDGSKARCCGCSMPLKGMSASCAHAKAVKRVAQQTREGSEPGNR